jgi:hypothetical protein
MHRSSDSIAGERPLRIGQHHQRLRQSPGQGGAGVLLWGVDRLRLAGVSTVPNGNAAPHGRGAPPKKPRPGRSVRWEPRTHCGTLMPQLSRPLSRRGWPNLERIEKPPCPYLFRTARPQWKRPRHQAAPGCWPPCARVWNSAGPTARRLPAMSLPSRA